MPIITKAGTPVKGSSTQFTLSKPDLLLLISDVYYSDDTNWKSVQLNYRSSVGKQSTAVKFDPAASPCVGNFSVSSRARDVFQIHEIVIKDFDGGTLKISRADLIVADFDVDMT